jgi:hypothetical protein
VCALGCESLSGLEEEPVKRSANLCEIKTKRKDSLVVEPLVSPKLREIGILPVGRLGADKCCVSFVVTIGVTRVLSAYAVLYLDPSFTVLLPSTSPQFAAYPVRVKFCAVLLLRFKVSAQYGNHLAGHSWVHGVPLCEPFVKVVHAIVGDIVSPLCALILSISR